MIETLTVITLCVLFLVFFRPGKTPPLDNPLVIERPGKYKMTLAPKLNLAQPFIEAISGQMDKLSLSAQHGNTVQCFAVNDKQVAANKNNVYLLAIVLREGMLYFLAEPPKSDDPAIILKPSKTLPRICLQIFRRLMREARYLAKISSMPCNRCRGSEVLLSTYCRTRRMFSPASAAGARRCYLA